MPYPALPDRRMPYDNDGTDVYWWGDFVGCETAVSAGDRQKLNGITWEEVHHAGQVGGGPGDPDPPHAGLCFFFPESREVTGVYAVLLDTGSAYSSYNPNTIDKVYGSNDSTNGLDGTWEEAVFAEPAFGASDEWRAGIVPISFTGPKRVVVVAGIMGAQMGEAAALTGAIICHLYGEKAAGQTPDDLLFLNHDDTPGVEFATDEDFGDRPLATSVVRQFRVKNGSATKTANGINLQCNDTDFVISDDPGGPWVVTYNIASLGPGAQSVTLYTRNTTPPVGSAPLGPRYARIVATVTSWA